ncbi:MAG: hypothetical protein HXY22_05205 [Alphaproteobacteria bacterium]|nr:hypothetical protein [Alphaproteobacteria bacterium]
MPPFGPMYCETPGLLSGSFPEEPWNAISSGVIVLYGLLAWGLTWRHAPRAVEFHALSLLLALNGIGSVLWHGLRTGWALSLDVQPALIFLLLMALLWAFRVLPWFLALGLIAALIATPFLAWALMPAGQPILVRGAPMLIGLLLAGGLLVWRTVGLSRGAAAFGALSLGSAIAALSFRSIDPMTCKLIPFGTHFLWHILLSTAAFAGFLALLHLKPGALKGAGLWPFAGRAPAPAT